MASPKKRRKAAKLARKQNQPRTGPFRHPDGDRRRRGGITADQALSLKLLVQMGAIPPPESPKEDP